MLKQILLLFLVNYINCSPIPANITVDWVKQKVDQFSYSNDDYYNQRYIVSTDHWCSDGCPIFFYAGNEGDIFTFANNTGFVWENAARFKAMVVFAEHRYYGESMPYGNQSYEHGKKLGYLTSEQALADFAYFIRWLKNKYNSQNSPVITFGGSYGGMLAAWFRMKYPYLTEGALAGSAPLFQFPGLYDCEKFNAIVTKDFEDYSVNCKESIRNSWAAIRRLGKTTDGRQWLQRTFALCQELKTGDDVDQFVNWLTSTYSNLAMTDYPNAANFLKPLPAYPIKETCALLNNPNNDDKPLLVDIYNAVSIFYNYTGQVKCNSILDDDDPMSKGWDYQACTEMVMPVCADGTDMFEYSPWNITSVSANCLKRYGVTTQPKKAELMYGGKNISQATNIIFSNGQRDPWSAGGLLESMSNSLVAIKIEHACHHEDLRFSGPNDTQALLDARQKEIAIIDGWITNYYNRIDLHPIGYFE